MYDEVLEWYRTNQLKKEAKIGIKYMNKNGRDF